MNTFDTQDIDSDAKLAELMLYIAVKSKDDPHFGAVKLNKLLFFSDFINYRRNGRSITDAEYQRLPKGPVPKRALPVLEKLATGQRGFVAEREVFGGFTQKRLVPLDIPSLEAFTGQQIALVDQVVERFKNFSATEISDLSHTLPAWSSVRDGEDIPYAMAFIMPPQATEEDRHRALKMEEERAAR